MSVPFLYTFRRCPYAIRARMALAYAGVHFEVREILLKDKPASMLDYSSKGTVPVLVLEDGRVLDESRDILMWALERGDPDGWYDLAAEARELAEKLIDENDGPFKKHLDKYKYSARFPEEDPESARREAEVFLARLEDHLGRTPWLLGERMSYVDVAIFPFVRQLAHVDRDWFTQSHYTALNRWLDVHLASPLFASVMEKYAPWDSGAPPVIFEPSLRAGPPCTSQ